MGWFGSRSGLGFRPWLMLLGSVCLTTAGQPRSTPVVHSRPALSITRPATAVITGVAPATTLATPFLLTLSILRGSGHRRKGFGVWGFWVSAMTSIRTLPPRHRPPLAVAVAVAISLSPPLAQSCQLGLRFGFDLGVRLAPTMSPVVAAVTIAGSSSLSLSLSLSLSRAGVRVWVWGWARERGGRRFCSGSHRVQSPLFSFTFFYFISVINISNMLF